MPIVVGEYAKLEQRRLRGQADLIYQSGKFYLRAVVDVPEDTPFNAIGCVGVDMGIVNIATTSDGIHFSGATADNVRKRITKLKAAPRSKDTPSANRHLKKTIWKREAVQAFFRVSGVLL